MIPIFRSHHSILRSCLTVDEIPKPKDFKEKSPLSIFTLGKKHGLKDIFLLDSSFSGFVEAFKGSKQYGFNLRYGIQVYCCPDMKVKDEASTKTEHKLAIWAGSVESLDALKKIYSAAQTEGFYYHGRIDLNRIKELWHPDLILTVPFYDSFLFQNLSHFECNIVPDWGDLKPIFFCEEHGLPFDSWLNVAVRRYASANNFEIQNTHLVYYYKTENFYNYMVLRCIGERSTLDRPNINFLCSDKFSFENYLKLSGLPTNDLDITRETVEGFGL